MKNIISILTDFGLEDNFVGVMKAVIFKNNPNIKIIDLCHSIKPQNIFEAGFILQSSYKYFPKGTIHLVVVDPGVGSRRKAIAVKTKDYFFVGPDNGVFSFVMEKEKIEKIVQITNTRYFLKPISDTFHGRDIFAPVAAWISRGIELENFGKKILKIKKINLPRPRIIKDRLIGQIIYIDRFGNLVSNIERDIFERFIGRKRYRIIFKRNKINKISSSYLQSKKNLPLAIFDSFDRLEISVNQKSAKRLLKAKEKEKIVVQRNV